MRREGSANLNDVVRLFWTPLVEELVAVLPDWALIGMLVAFVIALRALTALLFGKKASNQAWAHVFVNAIVSVIMLPFKVVWWIVRLPFR